MKSLKIALLSTLAIIMSGCVGTNLNVVQGFAYQASDSFSYEIIDQASVTDKGMSIFKNQLNTKFQALGLVNGTEPNKVVEITFTNYYMRHGAARALAGVMAGADNITTTVIIRDLQTDSVVGQMEVVSKNPTATGSARGLIEGHADKIAMYIKQGK
ncbi:DUF4410 domain-containing protein [Microbulbifer sp. SA54]|uniref:DUF4410 domain-containing protein n=1 Tax=Microbulbifer sp. SA54 TaxID=3401577 RepID=UPI003AAE185C